MNRFFAKTPATIVFLAPALLLTALATRTPLAGAEPPPLATTAPYESRQALGKGVTQAGLSNGLTVLVQENHAAPVATVRCFVRNTGSAYEGQYLGAGLSHLLEHLVAGGTNRKRSEDEIQKILDTMGGQTNAFTSTEMTAFLIDCPAAHVTQAIELVADYMQGALIPEPEYARELGVVQRELEMGQADRENVLHQTLKSLLYTEHPMRHPIIGYLPVVQQVKREDVLHFYRERYVPQNMVFVVVGDVETQAVLDRVQASFQSFPRTTERGVVLPAEPDQASPRSAHREMEGQTTHASLAWPTVPLQHPDLYPLDVTSYLLTTGDSSRLGHRLRIEQPLAIAVESSSYTPGFVKGWFEIALECQPQNLEACRQIIAAEVQRLQTALVSPQELAKVKRQKAAEHVFGQQTVQAQAMSLGQNYLATGDPLFDDQYVQGIQQVTAEQVREVARRYFRPERLSTVVIDPPGTPRAAAKEGTGPAESPVTRKQLANGLTVLLKRHAVTPIVSVQAFCLGGALSDTPETSGLAALTCDLLARGTQKYSGQQIAEYFDSIGGAVAVDSQRNTCFLQCSVLRDDFTTALDYLYQVLFAPTFPEDEFAKLRGQQITRIASRKGDPKTEILDFWTRQLPRSSPYGRLVLGSPETVAKLTVADCRAYHQRFLVPRNMVLAIYGDIDPAATLAALEKSFGQMASPDRFEPPPYPRAHEDAQRGTVHLPTRREDTGMVLISYPSVAVRETKTRASLDVLNAVLTGGGGAGGRLFQELRGQQLVYYVFGMEMTGPAPGYFLFLAQTRPETVGEVVSRIEANLRRIADEGIPADEFALTKQKLLAAHAMRNTTPAAQAFQAAIDELYGLGYDHDATYAQRLAAVTADEVRELVRQHFREPLVVTSAP